MHPNATITEAEGHKDPWELGTLSMIADLRHFKEGLGVGPHPAKPAALSPSSSPAFADHCWSWLDDPEGALPLTPSGAGSGLFLTGLISPFMPRWLAHGAA